MVAAILFLPAWTWKAHDGGLRNWDARGDVRLTYTGFNTQPLLSDSGGQDFELGDDDVLVCVEAHPSAHRIPIRDDERFHICDRVTTQFRRFKT